MSDPTPNDGQPHPQVISEDRAKQGRKGLPILLVLIVSATLAALVMFAVWMGNSGDLSEADNTRVDGAAEASVVDQPVEGAREEASPQESPGS